MQQESVCARACVCLYVRAMHQRRVEEDGKKGTRAAAPTFSHFFYHHNLWTRLLISAHGATKKNSEEGVPASAFALALFSCSLVCT
eukprot:scaffold164533_cov17-Tisochrysis_lutea.AAC.1